MRQRAAPGATQVTAGAWNDIITASIVRPADTTAYTAGDVIANSTSAATILTFAGMTRFRGGGGILQAARIIDSLAQSTKLDAELHLFDTAVVMQQDNAAWNPTDAEMKTHVGSIVFQGSTFKVCGANGVTEVQNLALPFACINTDLYGILVARNGYTPGSGEEFTIRLHVISD